jgi:phosphopantetheine--protein transferase-like protein
MHQDDALARIVASFLDLEPGQITRDLSLKGTRLSGSLARTRLFAAIQHQLGVQCQAAYSAQTYGELHASLCGGSQIERRENGSIPSSNHDQRTPGIFIGARGIEEQLGCGIDIETVGDLPVAADYWLDPFYAATFTESEIAYCLMQDNPPMHFAARWCAKEALKKCDAAFNDLPLKQIEVALTASGAPFLQCRNNGTSKRVPVALSLSHTSHMAAAVVVKMPTPAVPNSPQFSFAAPAAIEIETQSTNFSPTAGAGWRRSNWLLLALTGGAWIVALWALARSW